MDKLFRSSDNHFASMKRAHLNALDWGSLQEEQ